MIEFLCPRCQNQLAVPDTDAGRKQRCPKCGGKLRVPEGVVPHAVGLTIEFLCPRCKAALSAPASSAGAKQTCSRCGAKVRVSVPEAPLEPPAPVVATEPSQVAQAENAVQPPERHSEFVRLAAAIPAESPAAASRQRASLLPLVIPLISVALLSTVGAWLLRRSEPKLEGTLAGERLSDDELGPFRIASRHLGRPSSDLRAVLEMLHDEPLRTVSPLLALEFQGISGGVGVMIRTTDKSSFYRVDPNRDRRLARYIEKEKDRLQAAVDRDLSESVPDFLDALERRSSDRNEISGLADYRNSVGLASLVRGFGYHVQAQIGKQAFPCAHEDTDGRLYFALPVDTQEFEIISRPQPAKAAATGPPFPGRYQVRVVSGQ
jgi:DNA-directed RNA polymerase subunit RPC12/RpoP